MKETNKALVCTKKGCKALQTGDGEFCEKHFPKDPKQEVTVVEVEKQIAKEPEVFIKYDRRQIEQIKDVYAKGANDVELATFILVSARTGLDIFKSQIYLVPRWDNKLGKEVFRPQAGIDGFRAVAERTGKYAGNDDPVFKGEITIAKGGKAPAEAMVTVYKIVEGVRCPFTATARWSEYYPGEKIGFMWHSKPHIMLGKCAEALALRKAFPNIIQGFYESAEMDMTVGAPKGEDKQKKGLETIKKIISGYDEAQCTEYLAKIQKSEKYTSEQKAELEKLVANRVAELKK